MMKQKYSHFQTVVNQEIDSQYINEQQSQGEIINKQASAYLVLLKKLKERTDGFVNQKLPSQISSLMDQLNAF